MINKSKKIQLLEAKDIDKVVIKKVLFWEDEPDIVKDIIIEFPEEYGIEPISFIKTGLINTLPTGINYTEESSDKIPIVQMNFYGKLEEITDEDTKKD